MSPVDKLIGLLFFTSVKVTLFPVTKQLSSSQAGSCINQSQLTANTDNKPGFVNFEPDVYSYQFDDPNYFEGDLNVTQNDIDIYYRKERFKRAIRRDRNKLWSEAIVHYMFHRSINPNTKNIIVHAIHEIERQTCLHFELVTNTYSLDHLEFTGEGDTCLSNIGKIGGKQFIQLPGTAYRTMTCRTHGIVLHEILHALGVWHEQSRPDRNKYVQVLENNVQSSRRRNFKTRNGDEVDSHGIVYDYGSIMHYNLNAFSSNGKPTLRIINMKEYIRQGQPTVGQREHLSKRDIAQINRMYNCPGSGVPGYLRVYIKTGHGIPQTPKHDTYVKVKAIDDSRLHTIIKSLSLQSRNSSIWYEWIEFEKRRSWQFFEMSIWRSDSGTEEQLTDQQTFSVNLGYHKRLRYCGNQNCSIRIYFAYSLLDDGIRYQCNQTSITLCPSEPKNGILQIQFHLRDEWLLNISFVSAIAYNRNRDLKSLKSNNIGTEIGESGTKEWNQLFDFGLDTWIQFHIEIYYEDSNGLRRCTNTTVYYLYSQNSQTSIKQECDAGYICFDYRFFPLEHSLARESLSYQYFAQTWTPISLLVNLAVFIFL